MLIVKIRGMYGELDFVAYKTKYGDELPMADIYSQVSTRISLITLIQRYSIPLYNAIKTDFVEPGTISYAFVVVPAMKRCPV